MHSKFQKDRLLMDISKWPLDKVMQLPDFVFGTKFTVSCEVQANGVTPAFDISEIALPEYFILWQLVTECMFTDYYMSYIRIGLGEQLATTEAMFMNNEPLLHGYGEQGASPRKILIAVQSSTVQINLRKPVHAKGKKLTMMGQVIVDKAARARATIVISTVPKEVPDWVFSGLAGVR